MEILNIKNLEENIKKYFPVEEQQKAIHLLNSLQNEYNNNSNIDLKILNTNDNLSFEELGKREGLFRTMVENQSEGISIVDEKENFLFANPAAEYIFGLNKGELVGKNIREFTTDEQLKVCLEQTEQRKQGIKSTYLTEITRKDKTIRVIRVTATPRFGKNNKYLGAFSIFADISEYKNTEKELKRAKEEAERANRSKSDFIAFVSHEIRTPMSGVIGVTDLLLETSLNSKQKYLVDMIRISGENMILLLNDILDFSKLEYGKFKLENTTFSLTETIEESLKLFSPAALEKKIGMSYNIKKGVPGFIFTDKKRLKQILANLLSNAIKFTEHGDIELKLETGKKQLNIVELIFSVKDTGVGISDELQKKLFSPYEQENEQEPLTRKYQGTGLGLAICKKMSELLGGKIWVESKKGSGTTFFFSIKTELPEEHTTFMETDKQKNTVKREGSLLSEKYPFKILIAEDNMINRKLMLKILESFGYSAMVATNGKEVLEIIENESVDLIFMDIQMPVIDGFEATKIIVDKIPAHIRPKIIALTANALEGDRERCLEAGMDDYMSKPIRKDDLYSIIEKTGLNLKK
ncbi:MAG TPA: ATP-binding protein [Bacteroidales bacterium]|nr:ATP-binding protein [Bacteroidales bacterium]HPS15993.1 ATP-binding protein [Bacteroidales bacterium]